MNASSGESRGILSPVRAALVSYREDTGQSLLAWASLAVLGAATQIIFRRNLEPGEFGVLNSILAAIALSAVPLLALRQSLTFLLASEITPERREVIRDGASPLVQNFALALAFVSALLFIPLVGLLHLPRAWIGFLALPNVFAALGIVVCATLYEQQGKERLWLFLILLAAVLRLGIAWFWMNKDPWTEAGLASGLCAALVLLTPILRQSRIVFDWRKTFAVFGDQEFMIYFAATLSVALGIFLFTNADRIIAQARFGQATDNNLGFVHWSLFDGYQTAGMLGRSLLWGTQPLLVFLLGRRATRLKTIRGDYILLWIYLGALVVGALLLCLLAQPLARLFRGADPEATVHFVPAFAMTMIPLGLLQGLGFFALASRRYPECFALGASALAYTLFLMLEGNAQLMLSCMFGGGGVALMAVLFIAVVRWGRAQP